jgi:predicted Zn-ribbon and HTH transcriptional regulator
MQTIRQKIISTLSAGNHSARGLSQILRIREKEVYSHLEHIERSAASKNLKLVIIPSECLACGYVFDDRKRFTRPGRCPRCREERIEDPRYEVIPHR